MIDGLSIMTSFFAGYFHTDKGVTCSDSLFIDLSTAEECYDAFLFYAKSFSSKVRGYYGSERGPKGCYIDDRGGMYFNTHSTGSWSSSTTSICKDGNT